VLSFWYLQKRSFCMLSRMVKWSVLLAIILTPVLVAVTSAPTKAAPLAQQGDAERGQYVFALAGGCGCHMGEAGFLAGNGSPNITSDPETGIGTWTEQQIVDAVRLGRHPSGRQLGRMPFEAFSQMSDQDAYDLAAFLKSVPPVSNEVERHAPHDLPLFMPESEPPAVAPMEGIARGEYIVTALAHCNECHTTAAGYMAGGPHPGFGFVANLTPHETGLGGWSEQQIATYLRTGMKPDGTMAQGKYMPPMINNAFSQWTEADALVVAAYLKSIPPLPRGTAEGQPPAEDPAPEPEPTAVPTATATPVPTAVPAPRVVPTTEVREPPKDVPSWIDE
jgi:mono/diheme cytochrome c family protein